VTVGVATDNRGRYLRVVVKAVQVAGVTRRVGSGFLESRMWMVRGEAATSTHWPPSSPLYVDLNH
jgi:hypothetical protein